MRMNSETESLSLIIIVWGKPANKTTKHRREKKKKKKKQKQKLHKQTKTAKGEQNFKGKRKQPPPPPQKKKEKKKKRKAFTSLLGACGILSFYVLVPWSAAPNVVLHRLTDSP